jgi:hypothetical protein
MSIVVQPDFVARSTILREPMDVTLDEKWVQPASAISAWRILSESSGAREHGSAGSQFATLQFPVFMNLIQMERLLDDHERVRPVKAEVDGLDYDGNV